MEQPVNQQQGVADTTPVAMNESPVTQTSKQDRRMSDEWG